jgi:hypothetical protein
MSVPDKLHENDVLELNKQLYAAYNRIRELNKRVADLEAQLHD